MSCVAVERHGVCGGSGSVSGLPLCGLWVGAQQRHETAFSCGVWLWAGVSCKCLLRHTFDAAMPVCVCMYISDGIMMLQTYSEKSDLTKSRSQAASAQYWSAVGPLCVS